MVRKDLGTAFIDIGPKLEYNESDFVSAEVDAGSLVLIHGNVLHKSGSNTSTESRIIYTFHVIEGSFEYPDDNWLKCTSEDGFSKI